MDARDDQDRLERARHEAKARGRRTWFVKHDTRDGIDPLALYKVIQSRRGMPHEHPAVQAQALWWGPRGWRIALGVADRHVVPDASPGALEPFRRAWREEFLEDDAQAICAMVGVSFAGARDEGDELDRLWSEFGGAQIWLPSISVRGLPDGRLATTILASVDPLEEGDALRRHVTWLDEVVSAWLDSAQWISTASLSGSFGAELELEEPGVASWEGIVDETASLIGRDVSLDKVVLARPVDVTAPGPLAAYRVLRNLRERYPSCVTFAYCPPGRVHSSAVFCGATPECLVRLESGAFTADGLAGTASHAVSDEDFLASEKDRIEHAIVVEEIRGDLEDLADTMHVPEAPVVDRLANVKHLRTPITGTTSAASVLVLAERLHPTPAVCGRPRARALQEIERAEGAIALTRGWYAGALGWVGLEGDGELDVAIRCAMIFGERARVYVGAGIVADSSGGAEREETRLKARALLGALIGETEGA